MGFGASRFFAISALLFLRYTYAASIEVLAVFLIGVILTTGAIVLIMRVLAPKRYRTGASALAVVLFSTAAAIAMLSDSVFLGAFLFGTSGGILLNCWGNELADLNERDMVFAALLGWGLSSALAVAAVVARASLLLVAVGFGLFSAFTLLIGDYSRNNGESDRGLEVLGAQSLHYSRKLILSIYALLLTVSFIHYFSRSTFFATFYLSPWMEAGEEAVGAVILVALFVGSRRVGVLSVCRITLPVAVSALLLAEIVPVQAGYFFVLLMGSSLILTRMFLLLATVKFAHDCAKRRWLLFGIGTIVFYGAQLASTLLTPVVLSSVPLSDYSALQNLCLLAFIAAISLFVLSGEWFGSAEGDQVNLAHNPNRIPGLADTHGLTGREREVLNLMIEGLSEQEIANRLVVGRGTVHTHVAHIYKKFSVHGKDELLDLLRQGVAQGEDILR